MRAAFGRPFSHPNVRNYHVFVCRLDAVVAYVCDMKHTLKPNDVSHTVMPEDPIKDFNEWLQWIRRQQVNAKERKVIDDFRQSLREAYNPKATR